jgi:hypothetical protein
MDLSTLFSKIFWPGQKRASFALFVLLSCVDGNVNVALVAMIVIFTTLAKKFYQLHTTNGTVNIV